ncbi:MAG: hypothetical protein KDA60_07780, partial [Planctomycetales bacterium]|nr:hypothetical protein [Planctomycetales bacterium]
ILCTCLMFGVVARAATPEATLTFLSTASLALFVGWTFKPPAGSTTAPQATPASRFPFPEPWWQAAAIYATMGVGVLAKGPVGLVLPTAVIGMYCLLLRLPPTTTPQSRWTRRLGWLRPWEPRHFLKTCWSMRPITAIASVAIVSGPWYVWVSYRTSGTWLLGFLGEHNVGRALTPMEGHGGSPLYYVVAILVGMFPWSVVAIPAILSIRQTIRHAGKSDEDAPIYRATVFCLCWALVYVGLFTIARTKLPSYVVPAYPALAMLLARYLNQCQFTATSKDRRWLASGMATLAGVGILIVAGLAVAERQYLDHGLMLAWLGTIPLAAGATGWAMSRRQQDHWVPRVLLTSAILQSVLIFGFATATVSSRRPEFALLAAIRADQVPHQVATYRRLEPSWVFYLGQPIETFQHDEQAAAINHLTRQPNPYLITTREGADAISRVLGGNVRRVATVPYFMRDDEVVLLAPALHLATRIDDTP